MRTKQFEKYLYIPTKKTGVYGFYHCINKKHGLKIIAIKNKTQYKMFVKEVVNLLLAQDSGFTPKLLNFFLLRTASDELFGVIKMEHVGDPIFSVKAKGQHRTYKRTGLYYASLLRENCGLSHQDVHSGNICVKKGKVSLIDFSGPWIKCHKSLKKEYECLFKVVSDILQCDS